MVPPTALLLAVRGILLHADCAGELLVVLPRVALTAVAHPASWSAAFGAKLIGWSLECMLSKPQEQGEVLTTSRAVITFIIFIGAHMFPFLFPFHIHLKYI